MGSLAGKACIVTGASSGIGLAIVKRLAQDGANVVMLARSSEKLEAVRRATAAQAGQRIPLATDVTDERQVREAIEKTIERFGRIDVLVNAAGAAYFQPITETSTAQWDQVLDTNLKAVFLACKYAVPAMLAEGRGDIVNIGSIAAHQGFENSTAYCASKHGLLGFGRALALEVRKKGLRVVTITPGSVDTPLWDSMAWSPDRKKMLHAEDVASAVYAALAIGENASVDEMVVMPREGVL
ncbi:MAG: SDR family oxidoreductase [Chloroflexi bacterium]|nr:SDR family oxidoreductase [Chloroflexota bacterium]